MRIWTRAYRPFIMGGDVNAPVAVDVPVAGPVNAAHDIKLYVAVSPNGRMFVVDGTTGGIVGHDIYEVLQDIDNADPKVLKSQLDHEAKEGLRADTIPVEQFWRMFKALL